MRPFSDTFRLPPALVRAAALWFLVLGATLIGSVGAQELPDAPPPDEPNPWLSLLPVDAEPHWAWWRERMAEQARSRRARMAPLERAPLVYSEVEPAGARGLNDHPLVAEPIPLFGTAPGLETTLSLIGTLAGTAIDQGVFPEPNGSIPLARLLSLPVGQTTTLRGEIGDGLYGSAGTRSGDFDVYAFDARALQTVRFDARSLDGRAFDPALMLLDSSGRILATADDYLDGFTLVFDARLTHQLLLDGRYYLFVGGQQDDDPPLNVLDPFDAASGDGARSEGEYELFSVLDLESAPDSDYFSLELRAGDVIGANLTSGDVRLTLAEESGETLVSSRIDLSGIYPTASPLPGGGKVALAYLIDRDGRYVLGVEDARPFEQSGYEVEVAAFRSPAQAAGVRQRVFLDFDGAVLFRTEFPPILQDSVTLSPLSAFLSGWQLSAMDEDALIDGIVDVVRENSREDVRFRGSNGDFSASGIPGQFALEVLNSRDHPDPGSDPNTMRVVIGGSTQELGLQTVGIAGAIDPGNFETSAIAVVLLDLLSSPQGNSTSLSGVGRAEGTSLLELVTVAIGNIASHEVGHLFGDFHTRRDLGLPTVMDRGGSLATVLGVGLDGLFGSADDIDVDFGPDEYEPIEGLLGTENTLQVISFGLPAGGASPRLSLSPGTVDFGPVPVSGSRSAQVSLSNPGTAALEIGAVGLEGVDVSSFSLVAPALPLLLPAGGLVTIDLDFSPQSSGLFEAALVVESDDPLALEQSLHLEGVGGVPVSSLDPAIVDFGAIEYRRGAAVTRQVMVSNAGDGPMSIDAVVAGGHPERFRLVGTTQATVLPLESVLLSLEFRPGGAVGESHASLIVRTSDPSQPVLLAELLGRSDGAEIVVDPDAWFFGFVTLGKQITRTFRISNVGTRNLSVQAPELVDDGLGEITLASSDFPTLVPPSETRRFDLTFRPTERIIREGRVVVRSDDPDEPVVEVALVGSGNRPELLLDTARLDFGIGPAGFSATRELVISNIDTFFDLRVDLEVVGSDRFEIVGQTSVRVPATESRTVAIQFMSVGQEPDSGELVLSTNDPFLPETRVPLSGQLILAVPALGPFGAGILVGLLLLFGLRRLRRQ